MWLLSCDGDAFGGKRRWLRPGSTHLIGRTSGKVPDQRVCYINSTSVSRKHLIFKVDPVQPGDSGRVYSRSVLTATDSSSKGTFVDGQKYHGENIILDSNKKKYLIKLGQYSGTFKLEWKPVILTKAAKKEGPVLSSEREKLEHADIKVVPEYLTNETTHVIAKKRNTSEGLQALVQAKWLVGDNFVNALAEVCKSRAGEEGACPLEDDFDTFWPNEIDFITPTSSEPVSRPNDYLKPDPLRAEVFHHYSFIFLSQAQHDKLLPIIAGGGGKALLYVFRMGQSATADVIDFAKEVAGKKEATSFLLSQEPGPGGIVIVRPQDRDEGRIGEVMDEIQLSLNQRMIEQNELLDAILTKDTSLFRRQLRNMTQDDDDQDMRDSPALTADIPPLHTSSSSIPRPPPTRSSTRLPQDPPVSGQRSQLPPPSDRGLPSAQELPESLPQEQPPARRRRRIITTQTRAKFEDDYDPSQVTRVKSASPERSQLQSKMVQSGRDVDVDTPHVTNLPCSSKKRPAPDEDEDHELAESAEQRFDRMYPGQAALKRQRTEDLRKAVDSDPKPTAETESAANPSKEAAKAKRGKRKALEPEPEIKEKLQARVKFEENRRLEQEGKDDMSSFTQDQIKEMAKEFPASMFVLFDVLSLEHPRQGPASTNGDHPEWRGRQNFKKFRSNKVRNSDPDSPHQRSQRRNQSEQHIVTLEEVPGKGHGLGDEYWLETGHDQHRKPTSQHNVASSSRSQAPSATAPRQAAPAAGEKNVEDDEDDTNALRRRLQRSREEDRQVEEGRNALDVPVRGSYSDEAPKGTAGSTQTLRNDATQQRSQRNAIGKRPAGVLDETSKVPPAKKAKQSTAVPSTAAGKRNTATRMQRQIYDIEDDDEEDPTAFRRKRR